MVFEKKKIQIETLSEYLTVVRGNFNLPREEVAKKTNIALKFLTALETGNFKTLPPDVYVYGFLRQLASLYAVDAESLVEQYKKEGGIQRQISKQQQGFGSSWYKHYFGKLVVTPKILTLSLGAAFVVVSVAYIVWQVWSINSAPSLQVFQPADNAFITSSFVSVSGKTDPGMAVTINSQPIFVNSDGSFATQLASGAGPQQITVTAGNRFGKTLSKTVNITGQPAPPAATSLQLKINFNAPVTLSYVIDNQPSQTLTFNAGDSKVFSATSQILLSTSDAGATIVTLNGQVLGPMGRAKESLSNIPFFAQSGTATSTLK